MTLAKNDPRHGTPSAYTGHRCRCSKCTKAWAEYYHAGGYGHGESYDEKRRAKYRKARKAGYSSAEAGRRSHWSDPLSVR